MCAHAQSIFHITVVNLVCQYFFAPTVTKYLLSIIHVLMRDEKEGRKKQARPNKQSKNNQAVLDQGQSLFSEKLAASGRTQTHDTLHSRQSALPLSYQGMYMGRVLP